MSINFNKKERKAFNAAMEKVTEGDGVVVEVYKELLGHLKKPDDMKRLYVFLCLQFQQDRYLQTIHFFQTGKGEIMTFSEETLSEWEKKRKITCPNCNESFILYDGIMAAKKISGSLESVKCPKCGCISKLQQVLIGTPLE